jgi:hypothetical protein
MVEINLHGVVNLIGTNNMICPAGQDQKNFSDRTPNWLQPVLFLQRIGQSGSFAEDFGKRMIGKGMGKSIFG